MALSNPNPITIPSTSQQDFSDLWIYNINIHAPSVDSGRINIETLPYNAALQEIGPANYVENIHTDQLWAAVNEVPEVAVAMGAIFNAIGPLRMWIESKNIPQELDIESV